MSFGSVYLAFRPCSPAGRDLRYDKLQGITAKANNVSRETIEELTDENRFYTVF